MSTSDHKPGRVRRWVLRLLLLALALAIAAEFFCRHRLGLGDPPLVMTHPQIEYLAQPSRIYHRVGNTIAYNRWSMRSDDFAEHKIDPNELRVLVIGDSVINGGAPTDQRDIATETIRRDLATRIGRPVVVGNISAGSWGPPNMLAYVKQFGVFDADVVVIVLSSHDWNDVPSFGSLPPDLPTRKPVLALQEVVTRYLPRYLPTALGGRRDPTEQPPESTIDDASVVASLAALQQLIAVAQQSGARVAVAQHLERDETMDRLKPGHDAIANAARAAGANVIQLGPSFAQARAAGDQAYRDEIHPTVLGQRIIAQVLEDWIIAHIRPGASTVPAAGH